MNMLFISFFMGVVIILIIVVFIVDVGFEYVVIVISCEYL